MSIDANSTPDAIALRTATAVTVMIAVIAAVLQQALGAATGVLAVLLIPAGFVFSYHRRGRRNVVLKILLATGLLLAFAAFLAGVRGATNVDDTRAPLVALFLWVQTLHSFDVPRVRDLSFSLAASVVLLALAGSLAFSTGFIVYVLAFAAAFITALVLGHVEELRRGSPEQSREVTAGAGPDAPPERSARAPIARRIALLGVLTLFATSTVFVLMPRLPAAQVAGLPFSITRAPSIPGFSGDVSLPQSSSPEGAGSSTAFDPDTYFGYGESLDLRTRGTLSDELVLRVRTPRPTLYRAQAYDIYRDGLWTSSDDDLDEVAGSGSDPINIPRAAEERSVGAEVMQTFYVERDLPNIVFHAYMPREVYISSTRLRVDDFTSVRTPFILEKDTIYSVVSSVPDADAATLRSAEISAPVQIEQAVFAKYLVLPPALSERFRTLAREITASHATTVDKALAVQSWLKRNKRYTTDIPADPPGRDPVDVFVFERREGFCEQIASTMTLMLRASGVPARLVTGFGQGTRNLFTGYWEVRNSDAHAWVEVYHPGVGWIPYDPTFGVPVVNAANTTFMLAPLARITEVFRTGVLGSAARAATGALRTLPGPGRFAVPVLLVVGTAFVIRAVARRRRRHPREPDPIVDAWLELEDALVSRGLRRAEHETPLEFATRLVPLRTQLDTDVRELAVRFGEFRYGDRDGSELDAFARELEKTATAIRSGKFG